MIEAWTVKYWGSDGASPIEVWLDERTASQLKAIAKEIELLRLCGNTLRLPHSRALGDGLFELRDKAYGYRIYYTFLLGHSIVLLQAGNKITQDKDIKIARARLVKVKQKYKWGLK